MGWYRRYLLAITLNMFNHPQLNPVPLAPPAKKVMCNLFKQLPSHYSMRDGWRCVTMGCGGQFVPTLSPPPGVRRMLRWCVGSGDTVEPSTPYYKIRESTNIHLGFVYIFWVQNVVLATGGSRGCSRVYFLRVDFCSLL